MLFSLCETKSNQIRSNQFYLYSPESQSHCVSWLYKFSEKKMTYSLEYRIQMEFALTVKAGHFTVYHIVLFKIIYVQ